MNIDLTKNELPAIILKVLNSNNIFSFQELLLLDEDSLMRISAGPGKLSLSRKQLQLLKDFIRIHAPERINDKGIFIPQTNLKMDDRGE